MLNRATLYLFVALVFSGCKGFWGEKTDLSFIDKPEFQGREVAYVPIQPVLDQFVRPTQVVTGFDQLIYVVDEGTSEIVSFDVSGRELDRIRIPGLTGMTVDRQLDLLAIGTYDTIVSLRIPPDTTPKPTTLTLSSIYRIKQTSGGFLGLRFGQANAVVIHPFYLKQSAVFEDQEVKFMGIGSLGDNTYYVTRTGPNQNGLKLGGPDDAVLQVRPDLNTGEPDKFLSPITVQTGTGSLNDYFTNPQAITTYAQPPQTASVSSSRNFIFTSINEDLAIKVQVIKYEENQDGGVYLLDLLEPEDTSKAEDYLYRPERFTKPMGVTIAGDRTNYIFVVDAGTDSLYQFTSEGYEGVVPPAFSSSKKNIMASFGGRGIGLTQFNEPTGVAYFDNIVYVADAGNGRVLRFKLTTDFD